MIVRVIENNTLEQIAEGAMSCDGVPCEGESWVYAERIVSVIENDGGYIVATIEHPSGDVFTLRANYAQRIEIFH